MPNGFVSIPSKTGGGDRMQISFDGDRFELLDVGELHELNGGRHRAPLFVRLRDRQTGTEFIALTCHLARGDARLSVRQAAGLNEPPSTTECSQVVSVVPDGLEPSIVCL